MVFLRLFVSLAVVFGGQVLATSSEDRPATLLMTFFLPDSQPLSIEADLVSLQTSATDDLAYATTIEHFQISCPTARSPENDACRAAGIYPADVYHSDQTFWGGTTTYAADDSTTTWLCELSDFEWGAAGQCNQTVVANATTTTVSTTYGPCYVPAHQVPMVVTHFIDQVPSNYFDGYNTDLTPDELNSVHQSELTANGCPPSRTIMFAGAVKTSAMSSTQTPSQGSGTTATSQTAPASSGVSGTMTSSAAGSAQTSAGASSGASGLIHGLEWSLAGAALVAAVVELSWCK